MLATMVVKTLSVINKLGLHARASVKLINLACKFQSDIRLGFKGREVNAKSVLGVMALGATQGTEVELKVSGPDEKLAVEKITELFGQRFGESE